MTTATMTDAKTEAVERLREWFPKGSTVYTILRHVSASGMTRHIGVLMIGDTDTSGQRRDIRHPNHALATALGYKLNKQGDGVVVGGCGMDMGYHLVYNLAHELYGDGYALEHRWL